jgi:hypothetical protein
MTFLLSEDKALREKLAGITVTDQKADASATQREVGVWFGVPDQEIRTQSYPYITIDMIDIVRDTQREMRGKTNAEYLKPYNWDPQTEFQIDLPIPVNIDYQVTTYSRHPRHDREIIAKLLSLKLPIRFGVLELDDNTVRRLDVLDVNKRDMVENGKRLFMNAITIRVSSEVAEPLFARALYQVTSVHLDPLNAEDAGDRSGAPYYISPEPFTISAPPVTP